MKGTSIYHNHGLVPYEDGLSIWHHGAEEAFIILLQVQWLWTGGSVSDNSDGWGGGIQNVGSLTLKGVSISNQMDAIHFWGRNTKREVLLTINGGSIFDNSASWYYGYGGGIVQLWYVEPEARQLR